MSTKQLLSAILRLSPAERAELLREVNDRMPTEESELDETPEFMAELDRRNENWVKHPGEGQTWEQANREIKAMIQKAGKGRGKSKSTPLRKASLRQRPSTMN